MSQQLPGLTSSAPEDETKTLWFWQQMDQLYGVRWSQSFGNDPLGRYKDAEGNRNPRMDQWIETLAPVPWDRLRGVITQIKKHPKPQGFEGWIPDLPFVVALVATRKPTDAINLAPFGAWIGRLCDARLIRTIADHGPFNQESMEKLSALTRHAKEKFMALARSGDLSEIGSKEEVEVINKYLTIEYAKLAVVKMTPEEQAADLERWQRRRGLTHS